MGGAGGADGEPEGGGGGCAVCGGGGKIVLLGSECPFCNGTGEATRAAASYMKSHMCQCSLYDRKRCPLCGRECHHDTPNRPKILVGPVQ